MKRDEESTEAVQPAPTFIERMAGKLGGTAHARMVYGDPVVNDGITVIPVAKVGYGFGGGAGGSKDGKGEGGGGGVGVTPVGYIEIKDGQTAFHRIFDPLFLAPSILAGGVAGAMILRGIYRIMQRDCGASS